MANIDAKRGFQLARTTREVNRRVRQVDVGNTLAMAPGDAYTIEADGAVARVNSTTLPPNGICEAVVLKAKSGEGPESLDMVPATTACEIIGIEDKDAEFETQIDTVALTDLDTGKLVDIVDAVPDNALRESRQSVAVATGDQFVLVGLVDRIGNEFGANAKVLVKLVPANVL